MTEIHDKYVTNIIKWYSFHICSFKFWSIRMFFMPCVCEWNALSSEWMGWGDGILRSSFLFAAVFQPHFYAHWLSWAMIYTHTGEKVSLNRKSCCTFYILRMIRRWRKCNSISRTDRAYELSFNACERVNVSISKCISHAIRYTTTTKKWYAATRFYAWNTHTQCPSRICCVNHTHSRAGTFALNSLIDSIEFKR